jgi:MYXO-CTERM domain-containing protein
MKSPRRTLLRSLVALHVLALAGAAHASPRKVQRGPTDERLVRPGVTLEAAARDHVARERESLGLDGVELVVRRVDGGAVRFAQAIGGVPVVDGGVVVRATKEGRLAGVSVSVRPDLSVDPSPALDAEAAKVALESHLDASVPSPRKAELVILSVHTSTSTGTLAWALDVADAPGGTRYFVDAHDGHFVFARPLATHVLGRVHPMNAVETPDLVDVELPLFDEAAVPLRLRGWGGLFNVANYVSGSSQNGYVLSQDLGPSSGSDFLYDLPASLTSTTDELAQVNLYYHLSHVRNEFAAIGVDVDGAGWDLTAVANGRENGQALDNAFFSQMGIDGPFAASNLIVIGQGSVDFAYDSDVFKHEFGHYVSHNAIDYNLGQAHFDDLGISPFSGAIDEGIADYFACSDNDDAELGEASLAVLGGVRDLNDTSKSCPGDMLGEVHADGEIIGSFAWSVRELVGKDLGDRLLWRAIDALSPGADFQEFAESYALAADGEVTAGNLTAPQRAQIDALLDERGLSTCGRVIAIDDAPGAGTAFGLDTIGAGFGVSCEALQGFGVTLPSLFHYSAAPGAQDVGIRFSLVGEVMGSGDLDYSLYVRRNEPVSFQISGQGIPEVDEFDYESVENDSSAEIVIDASSDPPFDPSARYHLVLVSRSCPALAFEISASPATPSTGEGGAGGGPATTGGAGEGAGGAEGGAGGGGDDEGEDGCDCRGSGSGSAPTSAGASLLLGLAGLILSRRRRR